MQTVTVRCTGKTPLILHNVRLADPLGSYVRELKRYTSKRQKTEEDHLAIAHIEWEGGLYFDEGIGPYVPAIYPLAALKQAGAITKHKTAITRAVMISAADGGNRLALAYDGPRDLDGMWDDERFRDVRAVRVGQSRTMRTRPRFDGWSLEFEAVIDTDIMDLDVFEGVLARAGRNVGIGEAAEGSRSRFESTIEVVS